jgi:hypothetical protein
MKASEEFQIDAINKTDIPVAAVVVVTPSVQYLMIMFLYSTAEHDMNMNVV